MHRLDYLPTPARVTCCGLVGSESAILSVAARTPVARGLKVTLMVQLAPAATLVPHVFVCAKSVALVPVNVMATAVKAAVPEFVTVTALAALVVPTV